MDHMDLTLVSGFATGRTAGETSGRANSVPGRGSNGPKGHQQPDGGRVSGALGFGQQVPESEPGEGRCRRCFLKLRPLLPPAGRLIGLVDDLGLKLVVTGDSQVVSSHSLVLAVKKVDGTRFPPASVDIYSTDNVQVTERAVLTWTSRTNRC